MTRLQIIAPAVKMRNPTIHGEMNRYPAMASRRLYRCRPRRVSREARTVLGAAPAPWATPSATVDPTDLGDLVCVHPRPFPLRGGDATHRRVNRWGGTSNGSRRGPGCRVSRRTAPGSFRTASPDGSSPDVVTSRGSPPAPARGVPVAPLLQAAPEERLVRPRDDVRRAGRDELVAAGAPVGLVPAADGPHRVALPAGPGLGAGHRTEPVGVERDVRVAVGALASAPGPGHQGADGGVTAPSPSPRAGSAAASSTRGSRPERMTSRYQSAESFGVRSSVS